MFGRPIGAAAAVAIAAAGLAIEGPARSETFLEQFPQHADVDGDMRTFLDSLTYRHGEITLPGGAVTLTVGEDFYFLDHVDARRVLEEAWGNPPSIETLGMIFPAHLTPFHDGSWGAEVTFEAMGYVSDEEAEEIDYDALLEQMQADTIDGNEVRREHGYPAITLVGWASPPRYDKATRKLHWAKELEFEGEEANTLNYNIRALGRSGVLVINFIADMESLPEIKESIEPVLAMSEFKDGHRYEDFDPDVDAVAAVGIGGLIAGKVLSKTGLLAVALVLLKKFWMVLFLPLIVAWRWITGRRSE